MKVMELEGLCKAIGSREVLKRLTLWLEDGDVLGLVGPNGAGKTTTIRIVLGLLRPNGGCVRVFGMDPLREGDKVRSLCGVVFEADMLYEKMTVFENLYYWGRLYGISEDDASRRAKELLAVAGLLDRRGDKAGSLSKGMKRRVAFIRAMLHRPRLLILDEPVAGLDVESRMALRDLMLGAVRERGMSVIMASHDLRELERSCSRVALINKGSIVLDRPIESPAAGPECRFIMECDRPEGEILEQLGRLPGVRETAIRVHGVELILESVSVLGPAIEYLVSAGVQVRRIARWGSDLEQVYLEHLGRNGEGEAGS